MKEEVQFEKAEEILKEGTKGSTREVIQDRVEKVRNFLDDRSDKIWGLGIKETFPQLSDEEIEDIFYEARSKVSISPAYNPNNMIYAMRGFLESPIPSRRSKFRKYYKEFLYKKISQDAIDAKNVFEKKKDGLEKKDKFEESMTDLGLQFQLAFEDFFEPVIRKKELSQKTEDLKSQLKELGQQFIEITQDKSKPKNWRKKEGAQIQENIHKIKQELSKFGNVTEAEQIISKNLILPNYPLPKLYNDLYRKFCEKYWDSSDKKWIDAKEK